MQKSAQADDGSDVESAKDADGKNDCETDSELKPLSTKPSPMASRSRVSTRFLIILFCALATFALYVDRVGFATAYTRIARERHLPQSQKGMAFSAFYWGYAVSQVPGGLLATRFGGHACISVAFFTWSALAMCLPYVTHSVALICALRAAIGAAQGIVIPSMHTMLALWVPPEEKAKSVSLATSGMYLGSAFAMFVVPHVIDAHGATAAMSGIGILGFLWLALWQGVYSKPPVGGHHGLVEATGEPQKPVPWLTMLTCPAVWAIVVNSFVFHYALYMVMNWLPTYFEDVVKLPLNKLGHTALLPYLLMFVFSNFGGALGDIMVARGISVVTTRKSINTAGFIGASAGLMLMAGVRHHNVHTGILTCTMAMSFLGLARGGFSINHMDIAPNYAGVLIGISNTAGTLAGVVGVSATGVVLDHFGGAGKMGGWLYAFGTSVVLIAIGAIHFLVAARGNKIIE